MRFFISVFTFFLILLVLIVSPLLSQSLLSNVGVNFGAGVPLGNSQFKQSFTSPEINVYWSYQYLQNFDLKFLFGYGKSVRAGQNNSFGGSLLIGELLGVYSFSERFAGLPFFQFGFGVENFSDGTSVARNEGILIGGCGLKLPYRNNMNFLVSANLRYPFSDNYPAYFSKISDLRFYFKTGIQYDLAPSIKKHKLNKYNKSMFLTATDATKIDSSQIEQLQLRRLLSQNIVLRNNILKELEDLIGVQNRMIEALDVQLAVIKEKMERNVFAADYKKAQIPGENYKKNTGYPALSYSQVEVLYENALEAFNSRDYRSSISIFTNLKENFPYHHLFGNFVYWIGEGYFGLKKYRLALQAFEEVRRYGNSSKIDDAMVMSGICYVKLREYSKANKVFQDILKKYPNSEYKNKSKKYLAFLAGKVIS